MITELSSAPATTVKAGLSSFYQMEGLPDIAVFKI
jgi:hypothetical protein